MQGIRHVSLRVLTLRELKKHCRANRQNEFGIPRFPRFAVVLPCGTFREPGGLTPAKVLKAQTSLFNPQEETTGRLTLFFSQKAMFL